MYARSLLDELDALEQAAVRPLSGQSDQCDDHCSIEEMISTVTEALVSLTRAIFETIPTTLHGTSIEDDSVVLELVEAVHRDGDPTAVLDERELDPQRIERSEGGSAVRIPLTDDQRGFANWITTVEYVANQLDESVLPKLRRSYMRLQARRIDETLLDHLENAIDATISMRDKLWSIHVRFQRTDTPVVHPGLLDTLRTNMQSILRNGPTGEPISPQETDSP